MLSINTNLSSSIAQQSLSSSTIKLNQAIERMTTGAKINHAKDNAANYSISKDLSTKISSYDIAANNVAMGMDLVTTASDLISTMQKHAQRLEALSIQSRNGTYGEQSIDAINAEVSAIMKEIGRLSSTAEYNGVSLFEGGTEANGFISNPKTYSETDVAAMTTMTELVEGTTSADKKYSISSVAELEALAKYVNDGNNTTGMTFVLGANIDLSSIANWTPIGNSSNQFKGTFDGNGHIIKNLTINSTEDNQGLFGFATNGYIKNVGIENCDVEGGNKVGGLIGYADNNITNCYTTGNVSGSDKLGGLIGESEGATITSSYSLVSVFGSNQVGGIVGNLLMGSASIVNSYALGNVSGTNQVGGLAGEASRGAEIKNSYATGDVSGANQVGGLVGYTYYDTLFYNNYSTSNVKGTTNCGGLFGKDGGSYTISNCYSTGILSGTGGISNSPDWNESSVKYTYNYESAGYSINTDGSRTGAFTLQVGINSDSSCQIDFDTNFFYGLGAVKSDITSDRALEAITKFINQLSEKSTQLGAVQNRLDSALESIEVNLENLVSTRSTIRDADIAEESSAYIRQQILQQASATLLATANQSPSIALQLI